jgi:hypothetical protein
VCALSFASLARQQSVVVFTQQHSVLVRVPVGAGVLAAVSVTALMQENGFLFPGAGTAATLKGKTVTRFRVQSNQVNGSIPAVIGEMTALTRL